MNMSSKSPNFAEFSAEQMDGWMPSALPHATPVILHERGYRRKRC